MTADRLGPSFFTARTRIVSGLGATNTLSSELSGLGNLVAVVADRGVASAGLLDRVVSDDLKVGCTILVDANPGVAECEDAVKLARDTGCDVVLGIGGGSGLGLAKALSIRLTNDRNILDYEGVSQAPARPAPMVAIPTTAGSGSEVSNALVLHEPGRTREVIVRGSGHEPVVAILDGLMLAELPRTPMLFAALDALSHACESMWAKRRTLLTDAMAEKAAVTIIESLPEALETRNPDALQQLMEASTAANLACGNTGLGLIHALSSSPAIDLAHGYQNGALLLSVSAFNRTHLTASHRKIIDRVPELFDRIDWRGTFAPDDLDGQAIKNMIAASTGHPFRTNNIRASTDDELRSVIAAALS